MNVRGAALALLVLAGLIWAQGSAQVYQQGVYAPPQHYPVFPSGGGGGWGWGYGGGGTAAGSYMNGMANVVRSAGYANVMNSLAAQNYEQAYSMDLANRLQATNTYFEMRRINTVARAEERGPPPTPAELAHYAEVMAPKRLTASQLDPVTGEVKWPAVLNDDRYASMREKIDQLFSQRQSNSGGGASDYRALNGAIESLRAAMVKNIRDYSTPAYLEARKFLDSLQYEARFVDNG
jgi:hypothetical protein